MFERYALENAEGERDGAKIKALYKQFGASLAGLGLWCQSRMMTPLVLQLYGLQVQGLWHLHCHRLMPLYRQQIGAEAAQDLFKMPQSDC